MQTSLFTHPHVILKLCDFLSVEHKRTNFKFCTGHSSINRGFKLQKGCRDTVNVSDSYDSCTFQF